MASWPSNIDDRDDCLHVQPVSHNHISTPEARLGQTNLSIHDVRGGRLRPADVGLKIATWNVEGFTDAKAVTLQVIMKRRGIGILCLQETHHSGSAYYITEEGYLVILSGSAGDGREHAGVGFLISPVMRKTIVSFCQATSRMASLKLRISGGKMAIVNAYAPHSGHPFPIRQGFFHELSEFVQRISCHGPKILCGDFNARLYKHLPGESNIIGPYLFDNEATIITPEMNRHLLVELCTSLGMVVSNTFFNKSPDQQVTCYNVGHRAMDDVSFASHSQIDFSLCLREWQHCVLDVEADRMEALSSHHFLLEISLSTWVPKLVQTERPARYQTEALQDPLVFSAFQSHFCSALEMDEANKVASCDLGLAYAKLVDAFSVAAEAVLPEKKPMTQKPWISSATVSLIELRAFARRGANYDEEKRLSKEIKRSVASDKEVWLNRLTATGDWSQIRKLRRGRSTQQGRLKDVAGELVSSDSRATTLAAHLEQVQWAVTPTSAAPDRAPLFDELQLDMGSPTEQEVITAGRKLRSNRACGPDGVPGEFWKAILTKGSMAVRWAVDFCSLCISQRSVPDSWHQARVAMIFKKGDPSVCGNYRPISLVNIGYKLFAIILLNRLRSAGAENRIWPTQFGFRRHRGTGDALFVARRIIEDTWARRDGKVIFLALDWARAFDSVSPAALSIALRRFGCPPAFVQMIGSIYSDRNFVVKDGGCESARCSQQFGISQGCPLSPFLFSILMTVLLHDAREIAPEHGVAGTHGPLVHDIVYADDTLIIDTEPAAAQAAMDSIGHVGAEYGMSFNWSKIEAMPVRMHAALRKPDGTTVQSKDAMVYLGSVLSADGRVGSELGRRLGLAQADFMTLRRIWDHTCLSKSQKIRVLDACVMTGLTYGIYTAHLNQAERRRLDGFQARCVRRILKIAPSYYSRVANSTVLSIAGTKPLSEKILRHKMKYLGQLAGRADNDPVRQTVFKPHTFELKTVIGARRRGRPRHTWAPSVYDASLKVGFLDLFTDNQGEARTRAWESIVDSCLL